jgi:hypothetical protein
MIEAFLYVLDSDAPENEPGRLIMHRSYKDSDTSKVMQYMEEYIKRENLNDEKEIMVRVCQSDTVVKHDLDLRDYQ